MTKNQPRAKVLYIEDDKASQRLVERVLQSNGYQVFVAGDGMKGLTLAQNEKPQLILMDINLPGMDGKEITTRLRSMPGFQKTPIVALTANTSPGNREQALAAGCTGFLTKPINVAEFPQHVEDYLTGRLGEILSDEERSQQLELYAQQLVTKLEHKITELQDANQRLRELDRIKSDFIVLVSHELRTPLTLISGYAFLMKDKAAAAAQQGDTSFAHIADGLNQGVDRLSQVVNEIISVSRIASGSLDLALGPVRLDYLIRQILQDKMGLISERDMALHLDELDNLPPIEGDGTQLQIALDNVIGNAIKYTPDGGKIFITARAIGKAIDITVRDTGVGIPVEEQRRIFEQFHVLGSIQNHSTSKTNFRGGGLGLGLPIAKGIIEAHNGRIWVESKPKSAEENSGSTFHILLPLQQPQSS